MKSATVANTKVVARYLARQTRCLSNFDRFRDKSKYYFNPEDPPVRFTMRVPFVLFTVLLVSLRFVDVLWTRDSRCKKFYLNKKNELNLSFEMPHNTQYKHGKHRSNALELVSKQPVIEVDGEIAICDGGGGSLGHPVEYIALHRPGEIGVCKYCALKFKSKAHDH